MEPTLLFKALADDTRLKSLLLISLEGELCVCELMVALSVSQPMVSRHLAQLRKSGILLDRKQKQWVYYRISSELPEWFVAALDSVNQQQADFIQQELQQLRAMGERPERNENCCN